MNSELSTRVPLIISVPHRGRGGTKIDALVEIVDIYPTLCAAAGLPSPPGKGGKAGVDLMPLVDRKTKAVKDAAMSQFQRPGTMGYSIRTDRRRYTEWKPGVVELYDEKNDPDETVNVAADPKNRAILAQLSRRLHDLRRTT